MSSLRGAPTKQTTSWTSRPSADGRGRTAKATCVETEAEQELNDEQGGRITKLMLQIHSKRESGLIHLGDSYAAAPTAKMIQECRAFNSVQDYSVRFDEQVLSSKVSRGPHNWTRIAYGRGSTRHATMARGRHEIQLINTTDAVRCSRRSDGAMDLARCYSPTPHQRLLSSLDPSIISPESSVLKCRPGPAPRPLTASAPLDQFLFCRA